MGHNYRIDIIGIAWAGYESAYPQHVRLDTAPADAASIQAAVIAGNHPFIKFGDFQAITDARVVHFKDLSPTDEDGYAVSGTAQKIAADWRQPRSKRVFGESLGD